MKSYRILVADRSSQWLGDFQYVNATLSFDRFNLLFSFDRDVDFPAVINLRTVERCSFPSIFASHRTSFDIELFHRTLIVVCNNKVTGENEAFCETIKYYLSQPLESDKDQTDISKIDSFVDYYMMINNIQVEDLVDDISEFTLDKKKKFIANCNSLVIGGHDIVQTMFKTFNTDAFSSDINSYPQFVLDYPVASTLLVQLDGISFICHCLAKVLSHSLTSEVKTLISSYLKVLNEVTVIEEATSTIISSSLFFRTIRDVIHSGDNSLIEEAILIMSQKCEDVDGSADIITQCFIEEKNGFNTPFNQTTLAILISILSSDAAVELKMTILKFLAVLVYSAKSLSKKVALITEYHNLNFLSICSSLEADKSMSSNSDLMKILEITRDVMDVTITEEDLENVSAEDASSIAQIVASHCTDETIQSLYLQLIKTLLDLPAEGTMGRDLWSSLVEFAENLISVSSQWNERNLGLTMLKKKRNEKILEEEVESLKKKMDEMKSNFDELQISYNKSRCHEQELVEQSKSNQIEKKELEKKLQLMTKELESLKSQPRNPIPAKAPPPPPPLRSPGSPGTAALRAPPPPPPRPNHLPPPPPKSPPVSSARLSPASPKSSPAPLPHSAAHIPPPPPPPPPKETQKETSNEAVTEKPNEAPKKCSIDPVYKKYFKLKKMHMPIPQLKMKIQNEGLDPSVIDQDEPQWDAEQTVSEAGNEPSSHSADNSNATATSIPPRPDPIPLPEPGTQEVKEPEDPYDPPVRPKYSPSVPLRQVYWSVVSGRSLKDTIWERMAAPRRLNNTEIEDLFELKKQGASLTTGALGAPQSEEEVVSFVDVKRETNIGIGVRKLRYSGEEVKHILLNIDDFSLSADALSVMCEILPKESECLSIRSYQGEVDRLSLVNNFLYSVSEVTNCLDRAQCLLFRANFKEEIDKIQSDLRDFQSDCHLVLENTHFFYLLNYILDLGNYLNGSSTRGGACGFHLEILCQLERTKTNDNTMSLIDFIVREMMNERPEVLQVISEMEGLVRRTELSLDDINKNISQVGKNVNSLKMQITKPPLNDQDRFASQITPFYTSANEQLGKLRQFYKDSSECYDSLCKQFGENPRTLKSTEFFGYIVTFITSIKASHKHYVDIQAEEKLKKVAQDWQRPRVSSTAASQQSDTRPTTQPPPFRLSEAKSVRKTPPPIPAAIPQSQRNSTEQTTREEKKLSRWEKLKNWGLRKSRSY